MEKTLILKYHLLTGEVSFENPDGLTLIESMGLLEYAKAMVAQEME